MRKSKLLQTSLLSIPLREYIVFSCGVLISLIFLFNGDSPQVETLRAAVVEFNARVLRTSQDEAVSSAQKTEMTRLRRRTTELMLENSELRYAALKLKRLETMLQFKKQSEDSLISARVITINRDKFIRSAILDVGEEDGVYKNMPLIVPEGLCGKIIRTAKTTSIAQLLVDYNFRVAGKVERSRVDGIVAYEDGDHCLLKEVPRNADVRAGDVVVTSGYSQIFPPNVRIGVVREAFEDPRTLFKLIKIIPFVDFSRIEEVFVMTSFQADST